MFAKVIGVLRPGPGAGSAVGDHRLGWTQYKPVLSFRKVYSARYVKALEMYVLFDSEISQDIIGQVCKDEHETQSIHTN